VRPILAAEVFHLNAVGRPAQASVLAGDLPVGDDNVAFRSPPDQKTVTLQNPTLPLQGAGLRDEVRGLGQQVFDTAHDRPTSLVVMPQV
jgi:hypothetical protein